MVDRENTNMGEGLANLSNPPHQDLENRKDQDLECGSPPGVNDG